MDVPSSTAYPLPSNGQVDRIDPPGAASCGLMESVSTVTPQEENFEMLPEVSCACDSYSLLAKKSLY
jgi:hypothetical protein